MYEGLLKALRCCAVNDCGECGYNRRDIPSGDYCTDKLIPLAADAIEELSREVDIDNAAMTAMDAAMPRWISVTERLPKEMDRSCGGWSAEIRPSDDVLVWLSPEKRQSVAWYSHTYNDWTTADEKTVYCFGEVTHWMPLPQPPTECRQMVTDSNQLIGDSEQLGEPVSNPYKLEE